MDILTLGYSTCTWYMRNFFDVNNCFFVISRSSINVMGTQLSVPLLGSFRPALLHQRTEHLSSFRGQRRTQSQKTFVWHWTPELWNEILGRAFRSVMQAHRPEISMSHAETNNRITEDEEPQRCAPFAVRGFIKWGDTVLSEDSIEVVLSSSTKTVPMK